jgi:macrolide transport system ATP-binding/permease protein
MLVLNNVTKTYGDKTVLNKINVSFKPGEVVAVFGKNGEGKSTFLKIIGGETLPDDGLVDTNGNIIGYVPQFPHFENQSIKEFLDSRIKNELYSYQIDLALRQLELENIRLEEPAENLSGGQKTKLYLASLLLMEPEPTALLLDEPTNNLDINGLNWLEQYIRNFRGTILLTSHDRYFLDRTVHKVLELQDGIIKTYGGNYTFYKQQKQAEISSIEKMYLVQKKKIHQIREDIAGYKERALSGELTYTSRNPYNKKKAAKAARTAIVRQKKLEKFLESENFIEKPKFARKYGVNISGSVPSGKLILSASNIVTDFGRKKVLNNISFEIRGNERIWVTGKNGAGKSTLLNICAGKLNNYSGTLKMGSGVKTGYITQEMQTNPDVLGINVLKSTGCDETTCYNRASHLNLKEADLRKRVGEMSRGQVTKLEFTKLLLSDLDLLILDEPTNHLELETREEIEKALETFCGAVIIASHDRYFVQKLDIDYLIEL